MSYCYCIVVPSGPCGVDRARVEGSVQVHAGLPQPAVVVVTERVVGRQGAANGRQAGQSLGEQLRVVGLPNKHTTTR